MKRLVLFISFCVVAVVVLTSVSKRNQGLEELPVWEVLIKFGDTLPSHYPKDYTAEDVQRGYEIVHEGKSTAPDGSHGRFVSKFYVCTSCHNTVREDPDLTGVHQDERLNYAAENQIGYLQSSTFWGIVNRESWYNDDYVKKYGDLVVKANKSLPESIQLCATLCSQGRALEDWEMRAVLSYYWSLQYRMKDLEFSSDERQRISKALEHDEKDAGLITLIKSKYLLKSPATFTDPPADKKIGYGMTGRPEMGAKIFKYGCQHCHRPKGESDVVFNDSRATFRWLYRHITDNTQLSIYEIIRHGTYSQTGHKEYMPHYTLEKMSHQQVEDLRAYITKEAGK